MFNLNYETPESERLSKLSDEKLIQELELVGLSKSEIDNKNPDVDDPELKRFAYIAFTAAAINRPKLAAKPLLTRLEFETLQIEWDTIYDAPIDFKDGRFQERVYHQNMFERIIYIPILENGDFNLDKIEQECPRLIVSETI